MKLLIDIPEKTYLQIQALARNGYFEHDICGNSMRRIANGKPLDTVLDKIRAEIESIIGEHNSDDYDFCSGLICARKIINKYKRGEMA